MGDGWAMYNVRTYGPKPGCVFFLPVLVTNRVGKIAHFWSYLGQGLWKVGHTRPPSFCGSIHAPSLVNSKQTNLLVVIISFKCSAAICAFLPTKE